MGNFASWTPVADSGRFRILEPRGRLWILDSSGQFWILDCTGQFWTLLADFFFLIYSTFRGTLARLHLAVHNALKVAGTLNSGIFRNKVRPPGATFPTLCEKCVGSLTSPANQYRDAGDIHLQIL